MATSNKDLISKTLSERMFACVEEYESIKNKTSTRFKTVKEFCEYHKFSHQNFMKIYNRYKQNPKPESLIPQKRGPKYKTRRTDLRIEEKVEELRKLGNNRYEIALMLATKENVKISPSTVYNICKRRGLNVLTESQREERRKIITEKAGELAHIDLHQLSQGIIKDKPNVSLYVLGIIDDCTRTVWLQLLQTKKSVDVTFASLKALGMLNLRYKIEYNALISDNGAEFGSGKNAKNKDTNPFEVMLKELQIEHRYTKVYHPQTNGKIERFWRTLEEELLEGSSFDSFDNLKDELQGYSLYYNEYRPHSSLDGITPLQALDVSCN